MKRIVSIMLSIFIALTCASCGSTPDTKEKPLNLVTSFYPIYIMTLNITDGVDNVVVKNMADQSVGCLHDFQLTTDDMKKIERADAFIINGAGMESFMDKVTDQISNLNIIDSSVGIPLIYSESEHHHHHDNEDEDDDDDDATGLEFNPHIWLSIDNYIKQVENISQELIKLDPDNAYQYTENTNMYINKLDKLRDDMHKSLDNNISNNNIITFHNAFPYLAQDFNLNIAAVIESDPNSEPDAKELANIISLIEENDIKAIFVEPQYSKTSAEVISKETGAKIYTLDSAVSGSLNKDAYLTIMDQNFHTLSEALK